MLYAAVFCIIYLEICVTVARIVLGSMYKYIKLDFIYKKDTKI